MTHFLHTDDDLRAALARLVEQDPRLGPIAEKAGAFSLRRRQAGFAGLCAIVCGQQLSTASAAAIRDRLFAAFYTTKGEGMGIGLSISRSIIESHDGRLWAAPNDGPGSTFAFSIPCLPDAAVDARGDDTFRTDAATSQDHAVETF